MSIIDRDLIMRQLRFLQQLLARVMKVQAEKNTPTAIDELHGGYRLVLGVPYELLSRVDVSSALLMLRMPERQTAYVELLRTEAELLRTQGDTSAAEVLDRRAARVVAARESTPAV